jgi:hypothetical protein
VRDGRLGLLLGRFCKERTNERKEEEIKSLAEFCLNFVRFKFLVQVLVVISPEVISKW